MAAMADNSNHRVQQLVDAFETQSGLREALEAAATPDQAAAVAREHGFEVSGSDLLAYQASLLAKQLELNDESLSAVTGGVNSIESNRIPFPKFDLCI